MPSATHRILTTAFTLSAATALVAGCASSAPGSNGSSKPVSGGTLTYASGDAEPTCLDPHVGGNYPQALAASQFLEQLVATTDEDRLAGWLAEEWTVAEDGLSYTFALRQGITFSDGTAFDANAVKANIEHVKDPETGSSTGYLALEKVTSVDVVDTHTARINLSSPDSALIESLAQPWLAIESPQGLERGKDANCAAPIGTGPFVVDSWKKQDSIVFTRNESYKAPVGDSGAPHLDKIVWRFIPDAASRYAALKSGEVDVIDNVQPDALAAAKRSDALREVDAPRPGASNRIELNSSRAPFNDARVREAFVASADVAPGIDKLFFGTAKQSYSALSSVEPAGYSDKSLFGHDAKRAQALLDEAGWSARDEQGYRVKNGERLRVVFPVSTNQSIPAERSLFEQIQANTKKVGFEVVLEPLDLASWYDALGANEYDAVSAPYTKLGPDVLRILYHSAGITPAPSGYFANHSQVNDPTLDSLLTEASQTSDADKRSAIYEDAQKIILEGYYILPLFDQQNHYLVSSAVNGMNVSLVGTPLFGNAWLSK